MRNIKKWLTPSSIYLKLLPFLLLYIAICLIFKKNEFIADEQRYLMFAQNMLNGFYSPPYPDYILWNGPGYPIIIYLFLLFKSPLFLIRLANLFFLYFSLILSYNTFRLFAPKNLSFTFVLLLGFYYPIYEQIPFLLTECFTWFLISLICYLFLKNYQHTSISWKTIILAGVSIAYLAMTKIIFGIVIEIMLIISILAFLFPAFRNTFKKSVLIYFIAFLSCLPWLIYTYHITHKWFYWGNSGSMSLYTMSSPFKDELGDWKDEKTLLSNPNHKTFIDSISTLKPLQKDEAYENAAINNIKTHPRKYLFNWMANIGRLLFSYPYSDTPQSMKTYFTILPNMFIVISIFFSLVIAFINIKRMSVEILILLGFILIYLFGSTLVSAYRRMFYITIPFWYLFSLYVFTKFISIKIVKEK